MASNLAVVSSMKQGVAASQGLAHRPLSDDEASSIDRSIESERVRARVKGALFGAEEGGAFRIGKFVVGTKLGEGGMGAVYSAFDEELDRRVAIKILRSRFAGGSKGRARLLREAQAMAKLSHPNVVQVYEVGTHQDQVFVAMEYVRGETLRAWLKGERTRSEILEALIQAARGLAAAHAVGLVHRDFKPDNVMIGQDRRVRVLDFGLARPPSAVDPMALEKHDSVVRNRRGALLATPLTETGVIVGTPAYMAPEQHVGAETDARTDQFSFCVALYEALYAERPFAGRTLDELAAAVQGGEVSAPPRGSSVPSWLRNVVVRGLARKPEQRWSNIDELVTALENDPTKKRRRALYGFGAVILVGGALSAALAVGRADASGCLDSEQSWTGVWDDGMRSSLKSRIGAEAVDDWGRLEKLLDEYRGAWDEVAGANCEARSSASTDLNALALERLCLESSVDEVATLTSLLKSGDSSLAEGAVAGAERIGNPERCRGGETMFHRPLPPQDPNELEKYRRIRAELRKAEILGALARFDAQGETIEAARVAAEHAGFEGLAAEAMLLAAGLAQGQGAVSPGGISAANRWVRQWDGTVLQMFLEAFSRAQAAGDDVIAARAAVGQAMQLANRRELDEMETWLGVARSLVERTGDFFATHGLLVAESALAKGRGDHARAVEKMREALVIAQSADDPGLIRTSLGNMVRVTSNIDGVVGGEDAQHDAALREARGWHIERYGVDHAESRWFTRELVRHSIETDVKEATKLLDEILPPGWRAHPTDLDLSDAEFLADVAHHMGDISLAIAASERWFELAEGDDRLQAGHWLTHMYTDARDAEGVRSALERVDPTGADAGLEQRRVALALLENDPETALKLLEADDGDFDTRVLRAEALLLAGHPAQALPLIQRVINDEWPAREAANRLLEARIRHALGEEGAVQLGQAKCQERLALNTGVPVGDDLSVCEGIFKPPSVDP